MYVILCGNPVDGLKVYGPFESADLANEWAEDQLKNIGMDSWWCVDVIPAEKPVFYMISVFDGPHEVNRLGPYNTLGEALDASAGMIESTTEIYKCERIK